jgi:hypothetical protein
MMYVDGVWTQMLYDVEKDSFLKMVEVKKLKLKEEYFIIFNKY